MFKVSSGLVVDVVYYPMDGAANVQTACGRFKCVRKHLNRCISGRSINKYSLLFNVYDAAYGLNARVGSAALGSGSLAPAQQLATWLEAQVPTLAMQIRWPAIGQGYGSWPRCFQLMGAWEVELRPCPYVCILTYTHLQLQKTRFIVLLWHAFTAKLYATSTMVEIIKTNHQLLAITSGRLVWQGWAEHVNL